MRHAIVGDGFIGYELGKHLPDAVLTSRKSGYLDGLWPLDLLDEGAVYPTAEIVFLCAGVNGALTCARDPQGSWRVNVDGTVRLAEHYRNKSFFVWISSTTVEWGNDHYARQKRAAESILRLMPHVGIVRAGRVTKDNVGDLCKKLIEVGEKKIPFVLWGEDEKPYQK